MNLEDISYLKVLNENFKLEELLQLEGTLVRWGQLGAVSPSP